MAGPTVITQLPEQLRGSVLRNGLLLVDKPADWTGKDVLRMLKAGLRVRQLCHTGSLEPLATGLLLLCTGAATMLSSQLHKLPKVYTGVIQLGLSTDTHDATGSGVESLPWRHISGKGRPRA